MFVCKNVKSVPCAVIYNFSGLRILTTFILTWWGGGLFQLRPNPPGPPTNPYFPPRPQDDRYIHPRAQGVTYFPHGPKVTHNYIQPRVPAVTYFTPWTSGISFFSDLSLVWYLLYYNYTIWLCLFFWMRSIGRLFVYYSLEISGTEYVNDTIYMTQIITYLIIYCYPIMIYYNTIMIY